MTQAQRPEKQWGKRHLVGSHKNPPKQELKEAERNILRMNQIPLTALDRWINRRRSDGAVFTHGLHQRHVAPDGLRPASFLGSRCVLTGPGLERLISAGLPAPQSTPQPTGEVQGEEGGTPCCSVEKDPKGLVTHPSSNPPTPPRVPVIPHPQPPPQLL